MTDALALPDISAHRSIASNARNKHSRSRNVHDWSNKSSSPAPRVLLISILLPRIASVLFREIVENETVLDRCRAAASDLVSRKG